MTARVLVVDDIAANVKLLDARLSAEYFEVRTAMSGAEALGVCERAARSVDNVNRLRPAFSVSLSPASATSTVAASGSARQISWSFRPGTVTSPLACPSTAASATISTSRSVAVTRSRPPSTASKMLLRIGIVCRRSTTPTTVCRGFRIVSRDALNFIIITAYK